MAKDEDEEEKDSADEEYSEEEEKLIKLIRLYMEMADTDFLTAVGEIGLLFHDDN